MLVLLLTLLLSDTPQVIYFHAPWCKYCEQQDKIMKDIPVSVLTVNVDKDKELATKYNVRELPTIIILNKNSWDPKIRFKGVTSRDTIIGACR